MDVDEGAGNKSEREKRHAVREREREKKQVDRERKERRTESSTKKGRETERAETNTCNTTRYPQHSSGVERGIVHLPVIFFKLAVFGGARKLRLIRAVANDLIELDALH